MLAECLEESCILLIRPKFLRSFKSRTQNNTPALFTLFWSSKAAWEFLKKLFRNIHPISLRIWLHNRCKLYFFLLSPWVLLELIIAHWEPFVHTVLTCTERNHWSNHRPILFCKVNWVDGFFMVYPIDHPKKHDDILLTPTVFRFWISVGCFVSVDDCVVKRNEFI